MYNTRDITQLCEWEHMEVSVGTIELMIKYIVILLLE